MPLNILDCHLINMKTEPQQEKQKLRKEHINMGIENIFIYLPV